MYEINMKELKRLPGPILITGHTGFKGTWMSLLLSKLGIPVIGYSLPPETNSLYERATLSGAIPEIYADINDIDMFRSFVSEHTPSCIFHMAAQPLVLRSYESPRETFQTNVMGTVNVLDVAFATDHVQAIVVVTTDKVYRNEGTFRPFIESDALQGKDPYSASKVGTESVVAAWQQIQKVSGGPKVISVRAGNVIGGGDWGADRLLPDLVRSLINGIAFKPRNPQSTRPWQHVLDPLRGYIMALESVIAGVEISALNFGPSGNSLRVDEVLRIGSSEWDGKVELPASGRELTHSSNLEAMSLELDSTFSRNLLGWAPLWTQEEAVRSTISWWKEYLNNQSFSFEKMNGDFERIFN